MNDRDMLKELTELIEKLQADNSRDYKQHVLSQYSYLKEILELVYNPYKVFGVTGDKVLEYYDNGNTSTGPITFTQILVSLHNKILSGGLAYMICSGIIEKHSEYEDTIVKVFNKDLECGISGKTINAVWPGLVPEFNIPKAEKYKDGRCDFDNDNWFWSRKLNGYRCLCFIRPQEDIKFLSSTGREFETLSTLREEVIGSWFGDDNIILDGELCIVDEQGNENFKDAQKYLRRKDFDVSNVRFCVFDVYTIDNFLGNTRNEQNFSSLQVYLKRYLTRGKNLSIVDQVPVLDDLHFKHLRESVTDEWEGFMLKKDVPTKFKRSWDILKGKDFVDDEYEVVGVTAGEKTIDGFKQLCCGSLDIKHKGYPVNVGSGLSDEQRLKWFKDPSLIVGKTITVKYFEESKDKAGNLSLTWPTLKCVWEQGKE